MDELGDDDILPDGSDVLRAKSDFDGEPVRIPIDDHPEGELVLSSGRVEFIREEYGDPVRDHLYDGYVRWKLDTAPAVEFVTTRDEQVAERRLRLLEALVDNYVANNTPELAEAVGADADSVKRDLRRLAELTEGLSYDDGEFRFPDSDRLWAYVVEAKRRV